MKNGDGIGSGEMHVPDICKSLDKAGDIPSNSKSRKPLIQKVTHLLRNNKDIDNNVNNERYFTPKFVTVGPLHHGEEHPGSEEFKRQLAAKFIKYSGKKKEDFYKNVVKKIDSLRECYDPKEVQKDEWGDDKLAWMFLVDGCALLNFIYLDVNKKWKELGGKSDLVAFAKLDIFLLENQLPYQLLKILMKTCTRVPSYDYDKKVKDQNPVQELEKSIERFISMNDMDPMNDMDEMNDMDPVDMEPKDPKEIKISISENGEEEPAHLLELLRRRLINGYCPGDQPDKKSGGTSRTQNWHTFRNIKELKEHGIFIKAGKTSSVMKITFDHNFCMATLNLPRIKVDDYTLPKLMNLIAYEMSPSFINEFEINTYVSFLDSLIDKAEDVKELRDAGVLDNRLGSDKVVAREFNKISKNLVPNPEHYKAVKYRIQEHCNNTWITYVAQFYFKYFSSPWSILAFFGVLIGLGLTAMQTYKNFKPSSFN